MLKMLGFPGIVDGHRLNDVTLASQKEPLISDGFCGDGCAIRQGR